MKMKVIDLFNKMANGEPLPNKIKLQCVNSISKNNCIYTFNPIAESYWNEDHQLLQNATYFATLLDLDIEVLDETN